MTKESVTICNRRRFLAAEVAELVGAVGRHRVAAALGVHRSTVARWQSGASVPPGPALALLRYLAAGQVPGAAWRGWRFAGRRGDVLLSDDGEEFSPADLRGLRWQRQVSAAWERKALLLEAQLVAATKALAALPGGAANDSHISGQDCRSRAFLA